MATAMPALAAVVAEVASNICAAAAAHCHCPWVKDDRIWARQQLKNCSLMATS